MCVKQPWALPKSPALCNNDLGPKWQVALNQQQIKKERYDHDISILCSKCPSHHCVIKLKLDLENLLYNKNGELSHCESIL